MCIGDAIPDVEDIQEKDVQVTEVERSEDWSLQNAGEIRLMSMTDCKSKIAGK